MLSFLKGSYTNDDIVHLYAALVKAREYFEGCNQICDGCKNVKPCGDIRRLQAHLLSLTKFDNEYEKTNKNSLNHLTKVSTYDTISEYQKSPFLSAWRGLSRTSDKSR